MNNDNLKNVLGLEKLKYLETIQNLKEEILAYFEEKLFELGGKEKGGRKGKHGQDVKNRWEAEPVFNFLTTKSQNLKTETESRAHSSISKSNAPFPFLIVLVKSGSVRP